MKKGKILALLSIVPLLLPLVASAEKIDSFDTIINVNRDSTVRVEETIVYDFESSSKHGIFRDIPVDYKTDLGNQSAHIKDITVTDENGNSYNFTTSKVGNDEEIKIGDPNILISGVHTYKIGYTVERAIGYFSSYDEIYWNATGNEWPVPILSASAKVVLPSDVPMSDIRTACFYGSFGSTNTCTNSGLTFTAPQILSLNQGLTVAVSFPKGVVVQPSFLTRVLNFFSDNVILFLPVVVFIFMFVLWWRKGRDPKGSGVIIAEYDAPDNLTPLEIKGILKTKLTPQDISAEIIYLATRGYIKITKVKEAKFLLGDADYSLSLLKPIDASLNEADKLLLSGIFAEGDTVLTSSLKLKFYKNIPPIYKSVYDSLATKEYYVKNPQNVIAPYHALGVGVIVLVYILARLGDRVIETLNISFFETAFVVGVSVLIIIGFGYLMPAKTKKGAETKDKILGLKEYLQIAEKDRINFHDAPEKRPELFEKLLPYAMVLGVEKAWAKEFEGIYVNPPSWYNDPYNRGAFNVFIFSTNMTNFSGVAVSSLSTAPGRSSGVGGGGFSGGGGGGGGGGSW